MTGLSSDTKGARKFESEVPETDSFPSTSLLIDTIERVHSLNLTESN